MAEREPFEPRGDFVGGAFALPDAATGEIPLEDPGDLDCALGAFPFSEEAVDAAVASARRAWPAWRDATPDARAELLRRFGRAIADDADPLARLIAQEVGKPLWEARSEVAAMVSKVDITLGAGLELVREKSEALAPGQVGRWRAHARGVLAVLGPFNFPGHLVHGHVVPALATGNTVVVKPSERAAAVGQRYAELAARAGFPPGVFNLVQGDGAQGARLALHPELDGVLFTGSWAVGRRILEGTLDQPWKIVALELGGKNGALVCDDADLDAAAFHVAYGAAVTAGQRCSSTSRVFVDRRVADAFLDRLARALASLRIGYPLDDDGFLGPVISAVARERHAAVLRLARQDGAELLVAGGPCDGPRRGHYVRPTLHRVRALDPASRYQREEHFVPDAFACAVDGLDEGIAALEASDYGLVAAVFTRSRERYERVWREARVGVLNWNTSTVGASSKLPFGGVKKSGNDRAAAIASTLYCTYPVASLEVEMAPAPSPQKGFPWPPP
jgi:succinylglutamic semialdehyde dehydrogenase